MPALTHAFAEQNSDQSTTSSTYADVSGVSISSGSFTAGRTYLLVATAQTLIGVASVDIRVQMLHGSTAFADSEMRCGRAASGARIGYAWFTVWEAVSSEGIKMQFANGDNSSTVNLNFASLLALDLDELVEGTDWHFNEDNASQGLSTTPANGASITFTPGVSGDWAVLIYALIDSSAGSANALITRLDRTGEATSAVPAWRQVLGAASGDAKQTFFQGRLFTLGTASNTFTEASLTSAGTDQTRLASKVFALRLDALVDYAMVSTDGAVNLGTTNYGTALQSASVTPGTAVDTWILATVNFDKNNVSRSFEYRVQLDGADAPAGQTTANHSFKEGTNAADEEVQTLSTLVANLSAAAHTVDLDGSVDATTGTPQAEFRTLLVLPLEIPAAGQPATKRMGGVPGGRQVAPAGGSAW